MNKTLLYVRTWMTMTGRNWRGVKTLALFALLSSVPFGVYPFDAGLSGAAASTQQAKSQPISGVVVDKAGNPLIGVNIVEGPTNGTTTDIDGKFTINASPSSVLQVSYLGYVSQSITVGNQTSIKVVLQENAETLDEVVVVGYGVQKKVTVTGAVSAVQTKELKQSSAAKLSTALAGRLSGLSSMQNAGGQPGKDGSNLMLRGAATTNGTSPLILIDGVPRDGFDYLSPDEVASVSVLKDASSTAVFGVRGANGVILITTKRGSEGRTQLDLTVEQSWTSFTREPSRLHSLDYMRLRNEASLNDGKAAPYTAEMMAKYENPLKGLDPNDPDYAYKAAKMQYLYPDHDYYRELIKRYTPQTRVNMNISGGTEKVKYFVNAAYLHQGGNLNTEPKSYLGYDPSAKSDRYSFRANLDYQITKSFKAYLNLGSYIEQTNMPSAGTYGSWDTGWMMRDLLYQATTILPITPGPYVFDGAKYGIDPKALIHPDYLDRSAMEVMNRQGYHNDVSANLNATVGAEWDLSMLTKGLSIKGMASYDALSATNLDAYKLEQKYKISIDNDEPVYSQYQDYSSLYTRKIGSNSYKINLQASLNYNRTFGKHTVGGMVLVQRDYWEEKDVNPNLPFNMLGIAARATYDFDTRYLFEVNLGYNGSEQFAPGNRYGFFPAVSAGWVISNENFLKNSKTISNLKLRASYGEVGNDKLTNTRFLYLSNITMGGGTLGSLGNGQGVSAGLLGNPNLSWEIAKKQNYGFDLGLFNNELSLTFDYFIENRSDILIQRGTIPSILGTPLGNVPKANMGKVKNQGFEIELNYNKAITKDLSLNFRGLFSYNKNKQLFMDEAMYAADYVYRYRNTGVPLQTNWGYEIDYSNGTGMFNTQEELDNYVNANGQKISYGFGTPGLGDFKYKDLNNDGIVDAKDQVPIGYTKVPRINYGLTLGLNYKGIDFTVFFQGVAKYSSNHEGVTQNIYEYTKNGTYYDYQRTAWTKERYESGAKITYPALHTGSSVNHQNNNFFIMDRSFIRLKNIELGYTLPQSWVKAIGISKLRVYVSGQNLCTWSPMAATHLDPEQDDPIGYPLTKMINVGLNLTF